MAKHLSSKMKQVITTLAIAICCTFSVTLAWFDNGTNIDDGASVGGSIQTRYFEGSGTEEEPYEIGSAIQLYYFAWLQNLGYYNSPMEDDESTSEDESTYVNQVYFKLTSDIDMSDYTLPAIGTYAYPYVGNFDGNSHSITNVTIEADVDEIEDEHVPTAVYADGSDYVTYAEVIGFFGIVGTTRSDNTVTYKGNTLTYTSSINSVKDLKLYNVTINATAKSNEKILVGGFAGYLNASVENVGVANVTYNIATGLSTLGSFGESDDSVSNKSNYGLVGYARDEYTDYNTINTTSITGATEEEFSFNLESDGDDWGGSLAMSDLYTKLNYIYSNKSSSSNLSVNGTSYTASNMYIYNPTDYPEDGNITFYYGSSSTSRYSMLYGKDHGDYTYEDYSDVKIYIKYGSYYLANSGTTLTTTTDVNSATPWTMTTSGSSSTISTVINGTTRYLYPNRANSPTVTLNTSSRTWSFNGTYIYYYYNSYTYYFTMSSSGVTCSRQRNNSSYQTAGSQYSQEGTAKTVHTTEENTIGTYIPLKLDDDYHVDVRNTGYILSGANYGQSDRESDNSPVPESSSSCNDIRVGYYPNGYIRPALTTDTSMTSSTITYSDSNLAVMTQCKASNGNLVRIIDDYNSNDTAISTTITNAISGSYTYTALGLDKYKDSRNSLSTVLNSSNNIWGLHFMTATISMDHLVTAKKAVIDHTTYTNYEMPEDSIDFKLREDGAINFFAGSYFKNSTYNQTNDGFFSFYQIFRDGSTITDIKQISYVYQSDENGIYYQYSDGTYSISSSLVDSSEQVFDTQWIMFPNSHNMPMYCMYYYEIPTAAGEYALGSVPGGVGGYVIYLDIAANAQNIKRTVSSYIVVQIYNQFDFPLGVALIGNLSPAAIVDELDSIFIQLGADFAGSMNLSRNSNTVTVTSDSTDYSATYIGDNITAQTSSGSTIYQSRFNYTLDATRYIIYHDYNNYTRVTTQTTITVTDHYENNLTTPSSRTYSASYFDDNENTTAVDGTPSWIADPTSDDYSINEAYEEVEYDATESFSVPTTGFVLSYQYQLPHDVTVVSSVTYDYSTNQYTVTVTSDGTTIITVTNYDGSTYSYIINGNTIVGTGGTITVSGS